MDYVDARFAIQAVPDLDFVRRLLFTKFSHWHYEHEHRAFVNLDTQVDGHYFMDFSDSLRLKKVVVGALSAISRKDVAEAISGIDADVEAFKARAAFKSFEIVRNKDESMWA